MKRSIIVAFTILLSLNGYSQKREIPFFGKVKMTELCGSRDCRPDYGTKAYVHKNDKLYFNGNYNTILGRVISKKESIFETSPSGMGNISENDVDTYAENIGNGSIEQISKTEFDANVTVNLIELLKSGIDLPEDLKAKLIAEIKSIVTKKTENEIAYSFQIIQLKKVGDIDSQLAEAFSKLEKGDKIITGISVVTISGKWTTTTLKEVLDKFELGAGLDDDLTAELKLEYEKSKKRVLEGKVKEFGFIIGDSYKLKK